MAMSVSKSSGNLIISFCLILIVNSAEENEQKYATINESESLVDRQRCKECEMVAESFEKGIKTTEHMSYDGGDSAWAKEKLGPYSKSETRFVEIIENMCEEYGKEENKCKMLVEKWEGRLSDWWRNNQKHYPSLRYYLCVLKLKQCKPLVCNKGWEEARDEKVCADIDECKTHPCSKKEFCMNTQGDFACLPCHESCKECNGPEKCTDNKPNKTTTPVKRPEAPTTKEKPYRKEEVKNESATSKNKEQGTKRASTKSYEKKKEAKHTDPISEYIHSYSFYFLPHIIVALTTSFFFVKNPLLAFLWIFCVAAYKLKDDLFA